MPPLREFSKVLRARSGQRIGCPSLVGIQQLSRHDDLPHMPGEMREQVHQKSADWGITIRGGDDAIEVSVFRRSVH